MTNKNNLLPIGSVVQLHEHSGKQKVLIINRVVKGKWKGEEGYFEYAGCKHIIGAVALDFFYFNNEDIEKVFFEGYRDEEENEFQIRYRDFLQQKTLKKLKLRS